MQRGAPPLGAEHRAEGGSPVRRTGNVTEEMHVGSGAPGIAERLDMP